MLEIWTHAPASPRGIMKLAADLEQKGWDGIGVVDSQNLSGDPYVALAMAATVTESIGLGISVTNSVTRLAAVTASAIASVDRVSNGRASLAIGRGDSALAHLGRSPARMRQFRDYIFQLSSYLKGESVPFRAIDIPEKIAPSILDLDLADAPKESKIHWHSGKREIPLEIAATGPNTIKLAALTCDRIMFALGADIDRVAWGINLAKEERRKSGLNPEGISFGVYINAICHSNLDIAQQLVKGGLTTFARFSVMHGKVHGPVSPEMERALKSVRDAYDMNAHTKGDSRQASILTPEFINYFSIVGPPDHCVKRIYKLYELGLDKVFIAANFGLNETQEGSEAKQMMETEVIPVLKKLSST